MGEFLLKGHISYATKRKYKWLAEFGKNTCEQCASLDGQEFDEDDVPYWPHPNCRCKVEEISVVDEVESEMNEYKEEIEQLKFTANELLGDTKLLEEQIEKAIKEAQAKEVNSLEVKLTRLEYDIYQLINKIETLTRETIDKYMINKIQKELNKLKEELNKLWKITRPILIKYAPKPIFDKGVQIYGKYRNQPDGAAFYEIAASKFSSPEAKEYIKKNGQIYDKISDLKNHNLEVFVRAKLLKQVGETEARGVMYHENSSVSQAITKETSFRNFISENKNELIKNHLLKDKKLPFEQGNLRSAYHYVDLINIKLDPQGNLYALVVDTYDFNKFETDPLVQKGGEYQELGKLEPYYNIAVLKIPKNEWINY